MRLIITAKGWAITVGLAVVGAMFLGTYLAKRPPSPPEPCIDSVEFASDSRGFTPGAECSHGDHRMEMYQHGSPGEWMVKCICQRVSR